MTKVIKLFFIIFTFIIVLLTSYFLLPTVFLFAQLGWSEDTCLVDMPDGSWNPRAVTWGDTIHLVWFQRYAYEETYYKRSTDCGVTWSGNVMLSVEDNIASTSPDVAVKGDTVIVVWNDQQQGLLVYRRSTDGGLSWEPIDTIECAFTLMYPSIDVVDDTFYIGVKAYVGGKYPLCFTWSIDNGVTWDSVKQICNEDVFQTPRITVTWPDVHIVFCVDDTISSAFEIFYLGSHDGGRTWEVPAIISHRDDIPSQRPFNTSWTGGTAVIWYDYKYSPYMWTGDIFFRRKTDSLGNWDEIDSLTTAHRAVWSDILAERTHLHVVWEDERNDPGDNFEIYYRESIDLGMTWLPEVRLTDAPWHSYRPSLACGGGYLHLFWQDRRDYGNPGGAPLYYKRKDLISSILENNQKEAQNILSVFPNPCRNSTTVYISMTESPAALAIFDVTGRRVFQQVILDNGSNKIIWEGKNQQGKEVKTGVYFIQLKSNDQTVTKKVIVLK